MLPKNLQLHSYISFTSAMLFSISVSAGAGGSLSISPDQGNETPQIQLENGGDNGMKAKTMEAETQQVMSQAERRP
ncbi:MAG: hypothetical protein U5P41_11180 [Gammaproteobacteria bacterium]|nr:hypothetical protein [Gammaproteobacteria bacterium]